MRELHPTGKLLAPPPIIGRHDLVYVIALVALVSIGMIMVYSTTAIGGGWSDLAKMGIWLGLGIPGLLVAARLPMGILRKAAPWLLVGCALALISLEIPGNPLAHTVNGATRWIKLPGGFVLQPSEYTKLAFVLFGASFLDRHGHRMTSRHWIAFLGVLGLLAGFIYKEPDLGTALVLGGTALCMLFAAGVDWKVLFLGVAVAGALVFTLAWSTPHQQERLLAYVNPYRAEFRTEGGYQVIQSWTAMARGGLWGVGLGRSTHKLDNRLPESETDFIFAIVAEEMGLFRAVGVLAVFAVLAWRGYGIAGRAPDRYSSLVASGITSWIAVQSCLNISVATGSVPNTGVPLPFISSGGSSLTALLVSSGVVIGISRLRRPPRSERMAGGV